MVCLSAQWAVGELFLSALSHQAEDLRVALSYVEGVGSSSVASQCRIVGVAWVAPKAIDCGCCWGP